MEHRFADYVLDDTRHSLTRAGFAVPVEPLVFDLLHLLVRRAGELVTRDDMIEEIWQGRIVSDSAVTACVAAARKAVGDDGKAQAKIRTIPRRGLMFVAEVNGGEAEPPQTASRQSSPVQRIRYARNADGHMLAYAVTGDGPDVLCFGPPLTMDLEAEWRTPVERRFIKRLSERLRYLRFDHLGSGQSERVEPLLDFAAQADDAAAVADAAGLDRFAAVSWSGGVLAAIHFAARYPERLTRLAIVGGYVDGRAKRGQTDADDSLKTMISEGWGKPDSAFATAFLTSYFPEGPLDDVRDMVRIMQVACPPETMLRDRDALNNVSVAHLLKDVQCPTLILQGRHNAVHPLSEAQKLSAGISNAELVIFETANHWPLPGNAAWEPFMDTLIDFLES